MLHQRIPSKLWIGFVATFTLAVGASGAELTVTEDGTGDTVTFELQGDMVIDSDGNVVATTPDLNGPDGGNNIGDAGGGANAVPSASFSFSTTNLTADFDASNSSDSDGTISSYSWQFGDGLSGTGRTITHDYLSADTYTVTLTVTDDDGAQDSISNTVTVSSDSNDEGSAGCPTSPLPLDTDPSTWVDTTFSGGNEARFSIDRNHYLGVAAQTPADTVQGSLNVDVTALNPDATPVVTVTTSCGDFSSNVVEVCKTKGRETAINWTTGTAQTFNGTKQQCEIPPDSTIYINATHNSVLEGPTTDTGTCPESLGECTIILKNGQK